MRRPRQFHRLVACWLPLWMVLLLPLAAGAQQVAPAPGTAGSPAAAPSGPGTAAPSGAPTGGAVPGATPGVPGPVPAPVPVPGGPPTAAPGAVPGAAAPPAGPAASPVVPLPEREAAGGVPAGPIGSFRFAPPLEAVGALRVQVFGTIEEEFTDNADQTKRNKNSEFRTSLAPGIAARIDRANSGVQFVYAPRLVVRDFSDTNFDQALTLRGRWRPTAFIELSAGDEFADSHDFRDVGDPTTRRRGTESFVQNRASLEAAYIAPSLRGGLSYTHAFVDNATSEDSQTHIVRPSVSFTGPVWSGGLGYGLTRGDFDVSSSYWEHTGDARLARIFSPVLTGVVTGLVTYHSADQAAAIDFTIWRARGGGTYTFSPTSSVEALVGVDAFDPSSDSVKVRPSGSLAFTHRFPLVALTARYETGFQERFQDVDNTGVSQTQSAGVVLTTVAFQRLTGTLSLSWNENRFQISTPGVAAGVRERTWDLEVGARYQILRPFFVSAGYVLTIRSSTDPTAEFVENRVRLGVTYTFDVL